VNEIRKDYLLNRFVIVAENRGARPHDFIQEEAKAKECKRCFFCPGNESLTPPETGRIGTKKKWLVRSFYNKFPAVSSDYPAANGSHEIIVETPDHCKQMSNLTVEQLIRILDLYAERTKKLEAQDGIEYVSVFKNQGPAAGTSILHAHSQLIALPELPPLIGRELTAFKNAKREGRGCVFCSTIKSEAGGPRKIFEDRHFLVIAPYASRVAYEAWFLPKRHIHKVTDLSPAEKKSLATLLKRFLQRLDRLFKHPSFNFYLHAAPGTDDFHFHIELLPRLTTWAGFELGNAAYINPVSPESAAKSLRSGKS